MTNAAITDQDHICERCGEHMAQCDLCVGMPSAVARINRQASRDAEQELMLQERAIRRAADKRQGWL